MWSKIVFGLSKGSILGPLVFNIYINGLFYMTELTDACNFSDDSTFHGCCSSLEDVINRLKHDANLAIEWFDFNYIKLNEDTCDLFISGHKSETISAKICQTKIRESRNQKLLGVTMDRQINFDEYLISLYKKTGVKLSALAL